jgi:hypothetical protein
VKSDFLELIGNARQRRSEKFRNQLYIFIVCLVLSVFIWALVRLSKEYYFSIRYNLVYTDMPGHLRITGKSDSVLVLRIKVQGYELISEHLVARQDREYEVSLRNLRLHYDGDHIDGYLLTNRIGKEIISQSSFPSEVFFVSPDTLYFQFERNSLRKVTPRTITTLNKPQSFRKDSLLLRSDTAGIHPGVHHPATKKER